MPGIRVILQERDKRVLEALDSFRILDREQIKRIAPFSSTSRANARLLKLVRGGLLKRSFAGSLGAGRKAIYWLPGKGTRFRPQSVPHQLAIGSVRLALAEGLLSLPDSSLSRWQSFTRPLEPLVPLIPDGLAEVSRGGLLHRIFLEVDLGTEGLKVWQQKGRAYLRLALGSKSRFRVAVVTTSPRRARSVAAALHSVTDKLFFISDLRTIKSAGFFGSHWLRPDGTEGHALL